MCDHCGLTHLPRLIAAVMFGAFSIAPATAFAQRFPFERSFQIAGTSRIDVSTVRGKIEIVAGEPGRIVVRGAATVRIGWNVPANAVELARAVAAAPPIEEAAGVVRLRPPAEDASQRAVTVNYQVQVPPGTAVLSASESGETSIRGVTAPVTVRTQSGAIALHELSGTVTVSTGSGAVSVADITGSLAVTTTSSAFSGSGLGSSLRVRTQSGEIDADFTGNGDVDVETGSSAIRLHGVRGKFLARTQSGRVTVQGAPRGEWHVTTGSSSVNLDLEKQVGFSLNAATRSGSVVVEGASVEGSVAKRQVRGTVDGGGSPVRLDSRSGSIRVRIGAP